MKIKNLEKVLATTLKKNVTVLGVDTASRTGWCKLKTNKTTVAFEYGFVDMHFANQYSKYNFMIDTFKSLIDSINPDIIVIEDAYYGRNIKTYGTLSRYGMVVYVLAHLRGKEKFFISPVTSRANLGLPHNKKKEEVHKAFKEKLDLGVKDNDIVDAIILALNGVIEELPSERNKNTNKNIKQRRLFTKTCKRNTKRKKNKD